MAAEHDSAADSPSKSKANFEQENRSRNLLARLRSILSKMADTEPSASDFAAHLEGRMSALWRAEEAFVRNGADLELIILDELQTFSAATAVIDLKGPTVRLDPKASAVVILAIHEMATNALKFGALSRSEGRLAISWRVSAKEAGRRLHLKWAESGVPVVGSAPPREGFGHNLITRRIAYELGGSGDFVLSPGGITCLIEIPL